MPASSPHAMMAGINPAPQLRNPGLSIDFAGLLLSGILVFLWSLAAWFLVLRPPEATGSKLPLTPDATAGLLTHFSLTFRPFLMSIEIKIRKNEPVDRAIRRMKKKLDRENIIKGVRAKRYYEKPCERRRRKEKVQAFTQMLRRRYES
jgi:small subunit ribosomal protein S21